MSATMQRPERATAVAGTWAIDPSHTLVEFAVKHLMITTVKGRFLGVGGTVTVDSDGRVAEGPKVTIDVASLSTGDEKRDAHLRSPDFFDGEAHRSMTFVGKRLEGDFRGKFTLTGDLTIRGTTREITLQAAHDGRATDPWGNEKMAFTATGSINRKDFGLTWNVGLEAGGVLVGDGVKILIQAQLVREG